MMPKPIIRAKRFNRMSKDEYITWLSGYIGVEADLVVYKQTTRAQIDESLEKLMTQPEIEKPTWVEAVENIEGVELDELDEEIIQDTMETIDEESVVVSEVEESEMIEEIPADSPFSTDIDYNSMTVRELQDVCRERGLTIRGTKADVVLRLRRNDEGITEDTQPEENVTEAPSEEAAEVTLDAPAEEAAVTEEVENNDESSEQTENIDE
jgi:hypothetical protein